MDANGTRFHLLLGADDWGRCLEGGRPLAEIWRAAAAGGEPGSLEWDPEASEVTLRRLVLRLTPPPRSAPLDLSLRRGAGRDRYGSWYWIDPAEGAIMVRSSGSARTTRYWAPGDGEQSPRGATGGFAPIRPPAPPRPLTLRGLAVTADHYLVVGVLALPAEGDLPAEPAGLLVFDLHASGPPRRLLWPAQDAAGRPISFAPFDMASLPGGGLLILDRDALRYWALDERFAIVPGETRTLEEGGPATFQPARGRPRRVRATRNFPAGFSLDSPQVRGAPLAIEALPDGTALVLFDDPAARFSELARFRQGTLVGAPASLAALADVVEDGAGLTLHAHDMALLPGAGQRHTLYVVDSGGAQALAFRLGHSDLGLTLDGDDDFLPLRLFGGKGLAAAGGRVHYDFSASWVPLVPQRRPRYQRRAVLLTAPGQLDGKAAGCIWHRLMIDGCLPPEAGLEVRSRAADTLAELDRAVWNAEPRPQLRPGGSELPFTGGPAGEQSGTYELLFQRAAGRYLQIELTLEGNGRVAPHLQALRAYYPRFSYLERYLPAVYRQDAVAASFLERFLANFEGTLTAIEDKIALAQLLLDLRSAPVESLEWLAGWLEAALDPAWDAHRRRLFLANAMTFFQWRGTTRGLQMALRLALDECVDETIFAERPPARARPARYRVIEQFRTRRTPAIALGDPTIASIPTLVEAGSGWRPALGSEPIERAYGLALKAAGLGDGDPEPFPARNPGGAAAPVWRKVAQLLLGIVPAATLDDAALWRGFLRGRYIDLDKLNTAHGDDYISFDSVPVPRARPENARVAADWAAFAGGLALNRSTLDWFRWREFLQRRYQRVTVLNRAYGSNWPGFAAVPLPATMPVAGPALSDWYSFESRLLPMHATAHQFRVLLPNPQVDLRDQSSLAAVQQERLRLADRLVRLEKPAHTEFSVHFYWAMFRVGEARLGDDTLIDRGSRAAFLAPPLTLGQVYVGGAYLAPGHPLDVPDRWVLGRERPPAGGGMQGER